MRFILPSETKSNEGEKEMKRLIVVCMFILVSVIWFGAEVTTTKAQNQSITVTRELRIGYSKSTKTYTYNWYIHVECAGRPPKQFDLTFEQYLDLYADAVHAAVDAGKAKETFSSTFKIAGDLVTESMKVSTTYQGRCVQP
jgi:hypothetical protein